VSEDARDGEERVDALEEDEDAFENE